MGWKEEKVFWNSEDVSVLFDNKNFVDPENTEYQFNIIKKLNIDLENKQVLEIGVGSGRDIAKFDKLGSKLNAIDISKTFIENISTKHKGNFVIGDMRKASQIFNGIDFVYSRWSILYLTFEEFKIWLSKAHDFMNYGGYILFSLRKGTHSDNIHKKSNLQSLNLNNKLIKEALPSNIKVIFTESIPMVTTESENDEQFTCVLRVFNEK